jgi:hypothetical protein
VVVFEFGLGGADSYAVQPNDLFDFLKTVAVLRLFTLAGWLDGTPALSRAEFARQFALGLNYYFVAAP